MRLAAVCAIYGGYDLIPPVPEGVDDAVLVTDVPVRSGWRNVVEPSSAHPRHAAKRPRARPDLYTDCDASLWIDGSVHVRDERFVQIVRERLEHHELVLWDHPEDRDCLFQEAQHCHDWEKYRDEPVLAQAEHYRAAGMPEHFGLWATTCIARRHSDTMRRFGDAWLAEMARWTAKDQVSFPFLLWRDGIRPGTFGIHQLENDLVAWLPHAEDLYRYRETVLGLESRIIHLGGEVQWLYSELGQEREAHDKLRQRRMVRAALALAGSFRPFVRGLRRLRSRT